ncbi:c-type cytochrome [Brevibacillus sp. SYSU BS000544]|uniref:c-type cytochrome n=1 Tax=Brevibacillus sp. SYSU BS000544 TaxID=3416443 RepID=UPI003CE5BD9E
MKNLILSVGGGTLLLLLFLVAGFTTVDAGLAPDHGAPYWGNSAIEKEGARLYQSAGCYACHSYRGQQSQVTGPELDEVGKRMNAQAIEAYITNGTKIMPAFKDRLTKEEIQTLSQWLSTFNKPIDR